MIRFSHTVFALPFAFSAFILASRGHDVGFFTFFWIIIAMVGARSAAMGFNRIADADIDAANPRTAMREIPRGVLSKKSAWIFVFLFSVIFIFAAKMLSDLCFQLSIPVLGVLFAYSLTKRVTSYSHVFLGFAISLAPIGAWIAVTGGFSWRIMPLSLGLLFYIAGFDILYACQDTEFDRKAGLKSIPARMGHEKAMKTARVFHGVSFLFFLLISPIFYMTAFYFFVVLVIGVLYVVEHMLVAPKDLSRINIAFFHVNSFISVILFLGILIDEIIR